MKIVTVTLNKDVDVDAFISEMTSTGNASLYVPDRAVGIADLMPLSERNIRFNMTKEETELLRNDPRVLHCLFGTIEENGIKVGIKSVGTNNYYTRSGVYDANPGAGFSANADCNWALYDCTSTSNPFATYSAAFQRNYTLDGTGVDVVIMDSGLQVDHPEFQNAQGVSRVQQIDWWAAAGQTGTRPWSPDPTQYNMPTGFYTDTNGHGTNVCSIMAGKTYGWAKNANIYVMNVSGVTGDIDPDLAIQLVTAWHILKPKQSNGFRRPTIVNMSFGYNFVDTAAITGVNYRGTVHATTFPNNTYGLLNAGLNGLPYRYAAFDADVEDALAYGVIVVAAAGNNSYKIDVLSGVDYNNYATGNFTNYLANTWYYHQGGSPGATPGVVCVGAIDYTYNGTTTPWGNYTTLGANAKAYFSATGPRINVWAPGGQIAGATCTSANLYSGTSNYNVTPYYANSAYKQQKDSGTSQASPQVAGVLACIAQMRPWMTYQGAIDWLNTFSTPNKTANVATTGGYADLFNLQTATQNYLYWPYQTANNATISGSFNFTGTF